MSLSVLTKLDKIKRRRAKWVKALRSGKYPQGQGSLCYLGRYCCLGVANTVCDLRAGTDDEDLSHNALGKLGLTVAQQERLITENDEKGKTFAQIADIIEKMPVTKKALKGTP